MVFSSVIFIFAFLPFTMTGYFIIRKELRNAFLLVMSLLFYAWGEPKFVFVMIASIVANYIMGLLIDKTKNGALFERRLVLLVAVVLNLSILFYYKYFDFFISNINNIAKTNFPLEHIALPIGISFFTFQGMSYIFDLYLGNVRVQKNFINIALYIALFPQLIAGPIVRYIDVNEQIVNRKISLEKFSEGIKRFIIGLSKKIIISNAFAVVADSAFDMPAGTVPLALAWMGAVAYTFQIYFDFSGYSDMAIGLGKMLGFEFLENFNYPYISKSVTEFWRRWHISLSTWFRDYIYIPLGGNRKGNVYFNLLIVFFVTGLWHGASWNFIVWGLWHGLFLIAERVIRNKNISIKMPSVIKWLYTIFVVIIGWVMFRAVTLSDALAYIGCMFSFGGELINGTGILLLRENILLFVVAVIGCLPILPKIREMSETKVIFAKAKSFASPVAYIVMFVIAISFTVTSTYNPFIYFNF